SRVTKEHWGGGGGKVGKADCLGGSECWDAETGSFGIVDVFGQQHSLRRRQHDIFGSSTVWPTPLSVPNPDPLAHAVGDVRTYRRPRSNLRSRDMGYIRVCAGPFVAGTKMESKMPQARASRQRTTKGVSRVGRC